MKTMVRIGSRKNCGNRCFCNFSNNLKSFFFSALLHTRYEGSKDDGKMKKHKFCPVLCTSISIFIL